MTTLYALPNKRKEVSVIVYVPNTNLFWTIEDRGNPNSIYGIDSNGKIEKTITIKKYREYRLGRDYKRRRRKLVYW